MPATTATRTTIDTDAAIEVFSNNSYPLEDYRGIVLGDAIGPVNYAIPHPTLPYILEAVGNAYRVAPGESDSDGYHRLRRAFRLPSWVGEMVAVRITRIVLWYADRNNGRVGMALNYDVIDIPEARLISENDGGGWLISMMNAMFPLETPVSGSDYNVGPMSPHHTGTERIFRYIGPLPFTHHGNRGRRHCGLYTLRDDAGDVPVVVSSRGDGSSNSAYILVRRAAVSTSTRRVAMTGAIDTYDLCGECLQAFTRLPWGETFPTEPPPPPFSVRSMGEPQAFVGQVGRTFGVEIECLAPRGTVDSLGLAERAVVNTGMVDSKSSYYSGRDYDVWQVKPDCSLGDRGAELVSPVLKWGDARSVVELDAVCTAIRAEGFRSRFSVCGLHVHVGLRDVDPLAVVLAYDKCQDMINRHFVSESRTKDGWVDTCWADEVSNLTIGMASKLRDPDADSYYDHDSRYMVTNLLLYSERGTIEFRQRNGTTLPHEIMRWTALLMGIVSYAQATGGSALMEEYEADGGFRFTSLADMEAALLPLMDGITLSYYNNSVPEGLLTLT